MLQWGRHLYFHGREFYVLNCKRLRNRPRMRGNIYQIWWIWEADTGRLQKPTVQSETFNHAASSLWTFRLCTTYTKPQPVAGLTAGRPETHKNAQSLKAALTVTHGPAECQRGSSRPPHRRWRSSTVAALRDGTSHPKNLQQMCQSVSTEETSQGQEDDQFPFLHQSGKLRNKS